MGLDLPQHTHPDLQRIKALAINEYVISGVAVRRELIGALVMRIIFGRAWHRDGLALWAALRRSG